MRIRADPRSHPGDLAEAHPWPPHALETCIPEGRFLPGQGLVVWAQTQDLPPLCSAPDLQPFTKEVVGQTDPTSRGPLAYSNVPGASGTRRPFLGPLPPVRTGCSGVFTSVSVMSLMEV